MREMTITEALVELKTLDSRIHKATEADFVGIAKNSEKNTDTWTNFEKRARANLQSAIDLINERSKIKSAIVKSNAQTTVKIGDADMTVAEAIERKSSIEYEKVLLSSVRTQLSNCTRSLETRNAAVSSKLDSLLESLVGSDKKNSAEEVTATSEAYIAKNGYCIADPISAQKVIDQLEERIATFEANVDVALSVSNARTIITIE